MWPLLPAEANIVSNISHAKAEKSFVVLLVSTSASRSAPPVLASARAAKRAEVASWRGRKLKDSDEDTHSLSNAEMDEGWQGEMNVLDVAFLVDC